MCCWPILKTTMIVKSIKTPPLWHQTMALRPFWTNRENLTKTFLPSRQIEYCQSPKRKNESDCRTFAWICTIIFLTWKLWMAKMSTWWTILKNKDAASQEKIDDVMKGLKRRADDVEFLDVFVAKRYGMPIVYYQLFHMKGLKILKGKWWTDSNIAIRNLVRRKVVKDRGKIGERLGNRAGFDSSRFDR